MEPIQAQFEEALRENAEAEPRAHDPGVDPAIPVPHHDVHHETFEDPGHTVGPIRFADDFGMHEAPEPLAERESPRAERRPQPTNPVRFPEDFGGAEVFGVQDEEGNDSSEWETEEEIELGLRGEYAWPPMADLWQPNQHRRLEVPQANDMAEQANVAPEPPQPVPEEEPLLEENFGGDEVRIQREVGLLTSFSCSLKSC